MMCDTEISTSLVRKQPVPVSCSLTLLWELLTPTLSINCYLSPRPLTRFLASLFLKNVSCAGRVHTHCWIGGLSRVKCAPEHVLA